MTGAVEAYGNFVLQRARTDSPAVFDDIANIVSFNGVDTKLAFNETTNFSSTGRYRTFKPSLRDPGTMQLTLHFDPEDNSFDLLQSDHDAEPPVLSSYRIEWLQVSPAITETFDAYVESISKKGQFDGLLEVEVTLRISGEITR